jgi:F0F1-type ATP synthase membrane subunit b/b'
MDDALHRIERAVAEMRTQMANGFAGVQQQFVAVRDEIRQGDAETRRELTAQLTAQLSAQIDSLRQELRAEIRAGDGETRRELTAQLTAQLSAQIDSLRQELRAEIRQGDADTRSQLGVQIDSLRDDVRIFAEAHVALEHRVTRLESRPR